MFGNWKCAVTALIYSNLNIHIYLPFVEVSVNARFLCTLRRQIFSHLAREESPLERNAITLRVTVKRRSLDHGNGLFSFSFYAPLPFFYNCRHRDTGSLVFRNSFYVSSRPRRRCRRRRRREFRFREVSLWPQRSLSSSVPLRSNICSPSSD